MHRQNCFVFAAETKISKHHRKKSQSNQPFRLFKYLSIFCKRVSFKCHVNCVNASGVSAEWISFCFLESHWDTSSLWHWSMKLISIAHRCLIQMLVSHKSFNKCFRAQFCRIHFYHSVKMTYMYVCPRWMVWLFFAERIHLKSDIVIVIAYHSYNWYSHSNEIHAFIKMSRTISSISVRIDLLLIHSIYYEQIIQLHVYIVVLGFFYYPHC